MRGINRLNLRKKDDIPSNRPVIIIIDDSPTIRRIIETTFRRMGCDVRGYDDPVHALRALRDRSHPIPDVAFVDLLLPKMNGYDLIRHLRSQPQLRHLAIIVISRLDGPFPKLKARLAGADAYLVKPFTTQRLIDAVIIHSRH